MSDAERIPTNLRTLLILEILGAADTALTPTQINQHIDLPKQTVHRLCATLEATGFLVREADGKRLRPSRRARLMGSGLLHTSRDHLTRHQVLTQVAEQVGETVNFVVPEESGMRYLDRVDTDWPFRIQLPVGTNVPFHSTASGKCFMASMPKGQRASFVNGLKLEKLTENTHQTTQSLTDDLAHCAKRGYALDTEEFMMGMLAIAVPVTDPNGRFVAALAFHGPSQRLDLDILLKRLTYLQDGARRLCEALFH
jgi:DNA-binding IclR family transcriptional regulator